MNIYEKEREMKHVKLFEDFRSSELVFIYFYNPQADRDLKESKLYKNSDEVEGNIFYASSVGKLLEGFVEGEDYMVVEAIGDVKFIGLNGDAIEVEVKGSKYKHVAKPGVELSIVDIARKFEKMLQFASWKALNWLNKQTDIVEGSKKKLLKEATPNLPNSDQNLEAAKKEAQQISKKEGVVQHVNLWRIIHDVKEYEISDWYDSDSTVASYENGREI